MISSDVASCCSKKATSPIQESSNLSKAAIHSKKKKNTVCLRPHLKPVQSVFLKYLNL
jgi:hypothetical protein